MTWASTKDLRAAWREQALRAGSGAVCFLVAVTEGQVVGKAVVDWARNADGSAWLWMFSVHPDMAVDDDNPRARALYDREGYTVAGPYVDEYELLGAERGDRPRRFTRGATSQGAVSRKGGN